MIYSQIVTGVFAVFFVLGAIDRFIGNKFGLGAEYEKAFSMMGTVALIIMGLYCISPVVADIEGPAICTKNSEARLKCKPFYSYEPLFQCHRKNYLLSEPFNDLQIEVVPFILIHVLNQTLCYTRLYLKDLYAKRIQSPRAFLS